jgi:hypothetical protein
MKCAKLIKISKAVWEEITFWVEVMAEYLGWDRSPYHWVFEQYESDMKHQQRQEEIKKKQLEHFKKL